MKMKRKADAILVAAVVLVLAIGLASAWYNENAAISAATGARAIDRDEIDRAIQEGRISDHEASFYRTWEEGADDGSDR